MDWPWMLQRNKSVPLIHNIGMTSFVTSSMVAVVVREFQATWNERSLSNMIEIAVGMKVKATFNVETDLDIANEARELPNALHIYMYFSCFNKNSESEKEAVTAVWLFRTIVLLWRPCTSRAHEMANTFQF